MKEFFSYLLCFMLLSFAACNTSSNKEITKDSTTHTVSNKSTTSSETTPTTSQKKSSDDDLPMGPVKPKANPYTRATFETKIIDGKENTFGYEIAVTLDGKTQRIRQEHKPSVPGIRGFDTREDAQKVVDFVVNRIKTKGFPPTITPEELKQLGVLK